jgi:hypothetical protein
MLSDIIDRIFKALSLEIPQDLADGWSAVLLACLLVDVYH